MNIVVFGLSISSAWGNGHATLLRGLFRELHSQGHTIDFWERDVPYYASHRDAETFPFVKLHLYRNWDGQRKAIEELLNDADVAMITSYCPDAIAASELLLARQGLCSVFYDMDTPVTLSKLEQSEDVPYLPAAGLGAFDLVLSYTGGEALGRLRNLLGARRVAALYGWVDPEMYFRVPSDPRFEAALSYLGTYSADRQQALNELLLKSADLLPDRRFVVAGAMYNDRVSWPPNVVFHDHISPPEHPAFYSSCDLTLNVTRGAMAAMGYCPSGRLFEAAACGTPVLSDWWEGIDTFFEPDSEILIAHSCQEAIASITTDQSEISKVGSRARERTLACHTAAARAKRFVELIETSAKDDVAPMSTLIEEQMPVALGRA